MRRICGGNRGRLLSGGSGDVKPRWSFPQGDALKYSFQPSIPDKHFLSSHWYYNPATMWLRKYRPFMEACARSGYETLKSASDRAAAPVIRIVQATCPGFLHKVAAALFAWLSVSQLFRTVYGKDLEEYAMLDRVFSTILAKELNSGGFWKTKHMHAASREELCRDNMARLDSTWNAALEQATKSKSFSGFTDALVPGKILETESNNPKGIVSTSWHSDAWCLGMLPGGTDASTAFPNNDRPAISVSGHKDSHPNSKSKSEVAISDARHINSVDANPSAHSASH